jgi:hypothetical protein
MSWLITGSEKTPVDPQFGSVSLLLHGDGTNGSTTITDSSPTPKTVTAVGNAQISTAQSKFGGVSVGTWSHIAAVRYNGVARVYTNGVSGTPVNCSLNFSDITYPPNIGGYSHAPSTEPYNGYIDDLRITKGVARYTANFTPPTAPFPDI